MDRPTHPDMPPEVEKHGPVPDAARSATLQFIPALIGRLSGDRILAANVFAQATSTTGKHVAAARQLHLVVFDPCPCLVDFPAEQVKASSA